MARHGFSLLMYTCFKYVVGTLASSGRALASATNMLEYFVRRARHGLGVFLSTVSARNGLAVVVLGLGKDLVMALQ